MDLEHTLSRFPSIELSVSPLVMNACRKDILAEIVVSDLIGVRGGFRLVGTKNHHPIGVSTIATLSDISPAIQIAPTDSLG